MKRLMKWAAVMLTLVAAVAAGVWMFVPPSQDAEASPRKMDGIILKDAELEIFSDVLRNKIGGITSAGVFLMNGGFTFGLLGQTLTASFATAPVIDIGNVVAVTCLDTSTTVTGAAIGDTCTVGLPATPAANVSFTCYVSAADTVQIRVCNPTAAGVDGIHDTETGIQKLRTQR